MSLAAPHSADAENRQGSFRIDPAELRGDGPARAARLRGAGQYAGRRRHVRLSCARSERRALAAGRNLGLWAAQPVRAVGRARPVDRRRPGAAQPDRLAARRSARTRRDQAASLARPASASSGASTRPEPLPGTRSMAWDPAQYLKFAGPRLRPALDLLQRIDVEAPRRRLRSRRRRRQRHAADRGALARGADRRRRLLGRDAGQGRGREPARSNGSRPISASWRPDRPADVIYSNAALHWLDDHARLLSRLVRRPRRRAACWRCRCRAISARRRTPRSPRRRSTGRGARCSNRCCGRRRSPSPNSITTCWRRAPPSLDIWETEYLQVLEGANPVKEWTKGTWLVAAARGARRARAQPLRGGLRRAGRRCLSAAPRRQDAVPVPPHVPDRDGG